MAQKPKYIPLAKKAFNDYLDNQIDLEELITRLRQIELQVMSDEDEDEEEATEKVLWFRFFAGDPTQTTITDIEKELGNPGHPVSQILLRGIALGLDADELEVHYSYLR